MNYYYKMVYFILVITSFILSIPVVENFCGATDKITVAVDCLLFLTCLLSIVFWLKPIQNGTAHKFDGFFAKLSVFVFSAYICFYKYHDYLDILTFLLCFMMMTNSFILSNSCSKYKWCSLNHVINHFFFHVIIIITSFEYL